MTDDRIIQHYMYVAATLPALTTLFQRRAQLRGPLSHYQFIGGCSSFNFHLSVGGRATLIA